jgi:RNA polymerase sigma-70 factor (ECF subfamily)
MVAALVRALPGARRPADRSALRPAVEAAWRRAREAHPACAVSPVALFAYIGERIAGGDPVIEIEHRHVGDLYVACGCEQADPAALAVLEREVLPRVDRALASLPLCADDRAEVIQVLRERMLVAGDGRPGIAGYDGRAPLATWLRVCAIRMARRHANRGRRAVEIDDDALDHLAPGVPDPELAYFKQHYGAQFRAAFRVAVASLTARERNLLRYSVTDGFGIDQIAAIYHVHRATAARQLRQARQALADATRQRMRDALGVGEHELDSILRVLMSMTDAALQEILARDRGGHGSE